MLSTKSAKLMDRAQRLFGSTAGVALGIMPLAAATTASGAQLVYQTGHVSWGSGGAYTGSSTIGGTAASDGESVRLFGTAGPIAGSQWGGATPAFGKLTFYWNGNNIEPPTSGDFIHLNFDFDVEFTGGMVDWKVSLVQNVNTSPMISQYLYVTQDGTLSDSGEVTSFVTSPLHPAIPAFVIIQPTGHWWDVILEIDWNDYSPTDTLTATVPNHSIDYLYNAVPEPTGIAILGMSLISLMPRQKRN